MSMTISCRIGPVRAQGFSGQRAHDLRLGKKLDYVDSSRTHLNTSSGVPTLEEFHLMNEDQKYAAQQAAQAAYEQAMSSNDPSQIKAAKAQKQACRQKYDRDGVVAYRAILTFGRDAQVVVEGEDQAKIEKMAQDAFAEIAESLGTTAVGLTAHRDESALHFHGFFLGVKMDGKKLNPNKSDCRRIQDAAAKPFNSLGIKRGKSKELWIEEGAEPSRYINRSVAELHSDLPLELAQAQAQVQAALAEVAARQEACAEAQRMLEQTQQELARLKKIKKEVFTLAKEEFSPEEVELASPRKFFGIKFFGIEFFGTETKTVEVYNPDQFREFALAKVPGVFLEVKERERAVEAREALLEQEKKRLAVEAVRTGIKGAILKNAFEYVLSKLPPGLVDSVDFSSHLEDCKDMNVSDDRLLEACAGSVLEAQIREAIEIKNENARQMDMDIPDQDQAQELPRASWKPRM